MNDVENVISKLEKQRSAIDRAISALREITGSPATGPGVAETKTKRRHLSPEGRRRIIEATKRRWAEYNAKKAASR